MVVHSLEIWADRSTILLQESEIDCEFFVQDKTGLPKIGASAECTSGPEQKRRNGRFANSTRYS